MSFYVFHVSSGADANDIVERDVGDHRELQRQALIEAASAGARDARQGEESCITVTVRDRKGAIRMTVHLISQAETLEPA